MIHGRSILLAGALLAALPAAAAERLRVATFDVGMSRDGPGLLVQELEGSLETATLAAAEVIRAARPDLLLLVGFDHDHEGRALDAFRALLAAGADGIDYPHAFALPVNAGVPSGLDLDGDGRTMGRGDAVGWGRFPGNGGMALLSRLPIDAEAARSFTALPWAALPGAELPRRADGEPFPDPARAAVLRLSSRAHWQVPVLLPEGGRLHVLASNPTPPLFDGAEGFNRLRNRDEVRFWSVYLDGAALPDDKGRSAGAPDGPLVLLGNLNLDPLDGAGERAAITALLAHPRLQDPRPARGGGGGGGGVGDKGGHEGEPALDTADWRDDGGPGNLRVDYVLPSAELEVAGAGVFWPAQGEPLAAAALEASDHRLVWVDIEVPDGP
jgi:hypothetical protein